jgi:hypothetical protein
MMIGCSSEQQLACVQGQGLLEQRLYSMCPSFNLYRIPLSCGVSTRGEHTGHRIRQYAAGVSGTRMHVVALSNFKLGRRAVHADRQITLTACHDDATPPPARSGQIFTVAWIHVNPATE